ncbi:sulfate adenylyltransferase subunit CysN [Thiohalocapsa marina]|uniref:Multifunctional fusion protein n=1 Tax=Thiohalocapsa marina TaxID=424902 RepID=A0A5M8FVN6_9GAMM|nr:sulfate adenylyltransferase subunit CysN [Thiohalocapsa marina]KAA6187769.1 sulfate adenylyltransferase subunit CysN [Thiohalocapsa marina]
MANANTDSSYRAEQLIAEDIDAYLERHQHKTLLRFITCGSVDDGKSTLIGRLLYDSKLIFEDQLAALESDSRRVGTQGEKIDFALLVDGLAAEREQGITIDVAYRFFATENRKFIVADTPGHEQYTRNMVTGASTAQLAVILIDARKGVLTQTRRHSYLTHLVGIRHLLLAINKMDLVAYDQQVFDAIVAEYRAFAEQIGIQDFVAIPVSGLEGDNITLPSDRTPWYQGPTLLGYLESVELDEAWLASGPFRLPVQWVNRPNLDFRGFSGQIASGVVHPGDAVQVLPGGQRSRVARIVTFDGDLDEAHAGQSVTLTLTDEIDCSRGQVIAAVADAEDAAAATGGMAARPETAAPALAVADQFEATLVWMAEEPMLPGRGYLMKLATNQLAASITAIKHQVDINSLAREPATQLGLNDIGVCNLSTDRPVPFTPYAENPDLGGFILIDRLTNATVGAGLLHFALRRSQNLPWQHLEVDRAAHAALKGQQPRLIWLTGFPGAGKSSIANALEKKLHALGRHTYLLDGKNLRHDLNRDLGFTQADRVENIRRVGAVARLMVDAGLIVIAAFISPFRSERELLRSQMRDGEFIEVFVDTPLAVAEQRDTQGLYRRARAGELFNVTGIDSPYEPPQRPELHLDTTRMSVEEAAEAILERLFS